MMKRSQLSALVLGVAALIGSSIASAGEITGPPPSGNQPSPPGTRISQGSSICSYSGLNDTPDGIPGVDPGGIAQSYGYFLAQYGLFDPSDPDQRADFNFPGVGCNPNRGVRLPH